MVRAMYRSAKDKVFGTLGEWRTFLIRREIVQDHVHSTVRIVCALDGVLRCVANKLSNLRNADDVALFSEGDNKTVHKLDRLEAKTKQATTDIKQNRTSQWVGELLSR